MEGATIKIVKLPYYYQTWWFRLFLILTIAGVGYFFHRYRMLNLRRIADAKGKFSRQLIESQEAERKRISSELHDGLGQELGIIKSRAKLGIKEGDDPEIVLRQLVDISETASKAIEEVRDITNDLRPKLVDTLGLTKALKAMLRKASGLIEIESETDEMDTLFSEEDEINVYRIIQEAMNNVIKHSTASDVIVKIKYREHYVDISIEDNGSGFDLETVKEDSFGLIGLKERTNLLGGELTIDTTVGRGTTIKIVIPVSVS